MDYIRGPYLVFDLPLWEKDGNSLTEKSAYGYTCTATKTLWGMRGTYFDGTAYLTQATLLDNCPSTITVEFWFSPQNAFIAGVANSLYLFIKTNIANEDRLGLYLNKTTGKLSAWGEYNNGGNWTTLVSDSASWSAKTYYHAVITFNGSIWTMYIDGKSQAATTAQSGIMRAGTAADFYIGQDGAAGALFVGHIGEIRIYSRHFTFPEVRHNFTATKWRYK